MDGCSFHTQFGQSNFHLLGRALHFKICLRSCNPSDRVIVIKQWQLDIFLAILYLLPGSSTIGDPGIISSPLRHSLANSSIVPCQNFNKDFFMETSSVVNMSSNAWILSPIFGGIDNVNFASSLFQIH